MKRSSSLPFLRRRSTLWLAGGLVLLAIAGILNLVGGGDSDSSGTGTGTPTVATTAVPPTVAGASPTLDTEPAVTVVAPVLRVPPESLTQARVIDVIDGDTIDVELDGREERVRYYGIDTPERGDACFSEARRRNQDLAGDAVLLQPDERERDRSGRLLRYVFDTSGNSIDGQLIAEGLAYAWRDDGSHRDLLISVEDQARSAGAGCLWAD